MCGCAVEERAKGQQQWAAAHQQPLTHSMKCSRCWIFTAVGFILVNKFEWAASTWCCWSHRAAKSSCRLRSFFFSIFFFFHSPVRSYQDGIWETRNKIEAGLVIYWSLMAQTSGLHLDHVAGERQAMMAWQQANAAWQIVFHRSSSVTALFIFPNCRPNYLSPKFAALIFPAWFGEFNEEEKALEARWRGRGWVHLGQNGMADAPW